MLHQADMLAGEESKLFYQVMSAIREDICFLKSSTVPDIENTVCMCAGKGNRSQEGQVHRFNAHEL